jgi:hypothetical protein
MDIIKLEPHSDEDMHLMSSRNEYKLIHGHSIAAVLERVENGHKVRRVSSIFLT